MEAKRKKKFLTEPMCFCNKYNTNSIALITKCSCNWQFKSLNCASSDVHRQD